MSPIPLQWPLRSQPAPNISAFELPDYWVWDNSIVQSDDGRWHLFTTRWPKNTPYSPYWLYLTEIIRCEADRPEGPYTMVQTCFPERVRDKWDGMACHNPIVVSWESRWYLFYRGQTYDGPVPGPENPEPDLSDRFWSDWKRKSIGVAVADRIEGPWTRADAPILAPREDSWDRYCNSNPAPCILPDGTTYVLYKTRSAMDGPYLLGVARAPHPLGPYERLGNGPILGTTADNNYEDPFLWHDGERFHLLAKDMSGVTTGEYHAGIHAVSDDAMNWKLTSPLPVYSLTVNYADGSTRKLGSFERPSLVFENGRPTWLIGSAGDGPGGFWNASKTWIEAVPVSLGSV